MPGQYTPFRGTTEEEAKEHFAKRPKSPDLLLCQNCGFSAYDVMHAGYCSHVKLMYNVMRRGMWALGENYILKELSINAQNYSENYTIPEFSITKFLEKNSTIPVARESMHWTDSKSDFFFMKRVPGESLYKIGGQLTAEERDVIAEEVADYLVQLRTFTSDKPGTPDGSRARDTLFSDRMVVCYLTTDVDEWWARVEPGIRNASEKDYLKEQYSAHIKPEGPFVLTHGDLNTQNIMVKDKHVSGIIDWEHGGYFPEWWELVHMKRVENGIWASHLESALKKRNIVRCESANSFHTNFERLYRGPGSYTRVPGIQFYNRDFHWEYPSFPHYDAESDWNDLLEIADYNKEEIEKRKAEKKAIEDRIKTAEDRAKVAEDKLAEKEAALAEFKKLSLAHRENLKSGEQSES